MWWIIFIFIWKFLLNAPKIKQGFRKYAAVIVMCFVHEKKRPKLEFMSFTLSSEIILFFTIGLCPRKNPVKPKLWSSIIFEAYSRTYVLLKKQAAAVEQLFLKSSLLFLPILGLELSFYTFSNAMFLISHWLL